MNTKTEIKDKIKEMTEKEKVELIGKFLEDRNASTDVLVCSLSSDYFHKSLEVVIEYPNITLEEFLEKTESELLEELDPIQFYNVPEAEIIPVFVDEPFHMTRKYFEEIKREHGITGEMNLDEASNFLKELYLSGKLDIE